MRGRAATLALALSTALAPVTARAQVLHPGALFGLRFGGAQRQAAYVDLMHIVRENSQEWDALTLEGEAGTRAGQLGLGYAGAAQSTPVYHLQAVVMRTWKRPTDLAPAQTYAGAEAQISLLLGASYGYYFRVSGAAPGQARYHAVRLVVGF